MEPALCIETDFCRLGNRGAWKIGDAEDRRADFLGMLQRRLDFARHFQKVDSNQNIRRLHKCELLHQRSAAGQKDPVSVLFYTHEPKIENVSKRRRRVEPDKKNLA